MQSLEYIQLLLGVKIEPALINVDESRCRNGSSRGDQRPIACSRCCGYSHGPMCDDLHRGNVSGAQGLRGIAWTDRGSTRETENLCGGTQHRRWCGDGGWMPVVTVVISPPMQASNLLYEALSPFGQHDVSISHTLGKRRNYPPWTSQNWLYSLFYR